MIRRSFLVFALLVSALVPLASAGRMGASADLASAQDIFLGKGSYQISIDVRAMVSDEFQLRIPATLSMNKTSFLVETGVTLVYYPWGKGPFMGLSMFQVGLTRNCTDLENVVNLNEVVFGWSFEFGPGLFIEPAVVVRDPSGTFSDEYSKIKGTFPCYTTFRGRLSFGWYFWR